MRLGCCSVGQGGCEPPGHCSSLTRRPSLRLASHPLASPPAQGPVNIRPGLWVKNVRTTTTTASKAVRAQRTGHTRHNLSPARSSAAGPCLGGGGGVLQV